MIVIEGMDNSGKSTLGEYLAAYIGYVVQESEGPPLSDDEINARVDKYAEFSNRIFVRHPCVSNAIYGMFRPEGNPITPGRTMIFYEAKPLLIYCDAGERGFDGHVLKDHDTERHQALLKDNKAELLTQYRLWAAQRADFIYRIGDDMDELCALIAFRDTYRNS